MVRGNQTKSTTSLPERPSVPTLAQMESDILLASPDDPVFILLSSDTPYPNKKPSSVPSESNQVAEQDTPSSTSNSGENSHNSQVRNFYGKAEEFYQKNLTITKASSTLNSNLDNLKSSAETLIGKSDCHTGDG